MIGRASTRAGLGGVLVAAFLLGYAGTAIAASSAVSIAVGAPATAAVGDIVEVKAVVSLDGAPLEDATMQLTYSTRFAGVEGRVVLDVEETDENGVAVFEYEQRASDNGEMAVAYIGPDELTVAPFVFTIAVEPGGEQQFRSQAGVSIWWLNGWLVIGFILLIWVLMSYSAFQLVLVSRAAPTDDGPPVPFAVPRSEVGFSWVAVLLFAVTVVLAVGMGVVFLRNPLTHANLAFPQSYDRMPLARLDLDYPYQGPGLADPTLADTDDPVRDGRLLYFGTGCAGCHGLNGEGGAVGPELRDEMGSLGSFTDDVREGPDNMPGYEPGTLSDEDIANIHEYLTDSATGR